MLGVAAGVALWQRDVAERNAAEKEHMLAQSYQETGRQLLIADNPLQALPYIVAARDAGENRIPLRMMFRAAIRALSLATLEHDNEVSLAVFSPDGTHIATASEDHTARIWDAATGKLLVAPFEHPGPVRSVAFSSDGRYLLTTSDDGARLWDVAPDPGTLDEWKASAGRGPFMLMLADGVVAPRVSQSAAPQQAAPVQP